jgi:hypothetical protein
MQAGLSHTILFINTRINKKKDSTHCLLVHVTWGDLGWVRFNWAVNLEPVGEAKRAELDHGMCSGAAHSQQQLLSVWAGQSQLDWPGAGAGLAAPGGLRAKGPSLPGGPREIYPALHAAVTLPSCACMHALPVVS